MKIYLDNKDRLTNSVNRFNNKIRAEPSRHYSEGRICTAPLQCVHLQSLRQEELAIPSLWTVGFQPPKSLTTTYIKSLSATNISDNYSWKSELPHSNSEVSRDGDRRAAQGQAAPPRERHPAHFVYHLNWKEEFPVQKGSSSAVIIIKCGQPMAFSAFLYQWYFDLHCVRWDRAHGESRNMVSNTHHRSSIR